MEQFIIESRNLHIIMEEVQWRVSSLYVKDELCSRLIPLAAFFLFCFVHLQPLPYFSSAKPDKTTSLAGQVNLYYRRRKARKTTDRLKMRLKIFKPITKRGDAQNTYTKLLLVFNLKPLTSGSGGTNCIMLLLGKVHRYI